VPGRPLLPPHDNTFSTNSAININQIPSQANLTGINKKTKGTSMSSCQWKVQSRKVYANLISKIKKAMQA
jgi:hypothetical protein